MADLRPITNRLYDHTHLGRPSATSSLPVTTDFRNSSSGVDGAGQSSRDGPRARVDPDAARSESRTFTD